MRTAIVTRAFGAIYLKGYERLAASLQNVCPGEVDLLSYEGGPDHATSPYGFKAHALRDAERKGYDVAIWCDSNAHFKKHPHPILARAIDRGYWICTLGWNVGQWCTDAALPKLDLTREQAWDVDMVCAAVYALRFSSPLAQGVLEYLEGHEDALHGPWTNENGIASPTEGVLGHRHDQTVLSVAAHRLNLHLDRPPCLLDYAYNDGKYPAQAVVVKEGIQ